jgi:hypothetical protein
MHEGNFFLVVFVAFLVVLCGFLGGFRGGVRS